jgi:DNA-binding transcriptional LysR family regulator
MRADAIRAFVEIVDAGNLSEAAARRRGVTRSYISKELKGLEREAILLDRSVR